VLASHHGMENASASSLGGRGTSEPSGGTRARASGAAAASDGEWSRHRPSGLRRGEKGKKIRQRVEWRSVRHVRPGSKTRVGRPMSSISDKENIFFLIGYNLTHTTHTLHTHITRAHTRVRLYTRKEEIGRHITSSARETRSTTERTSVRVS
jgi:hypothetical protein